jgi:hypothetical protein
MGDPAVLPAWQQGFDVYVWPIGVANMEDMFLKPNDCPHGANGEKQMMRTMRMRKLIFLLCLLATAAMAEKAGGGLYKTNVEQVGAWELARYSRDEAGKQVVYCTAIVITGQEQALRVQFSKSQTVWGFMGEASGAAGLEPSVSYWFDNRTGEKKIVKMKLLKTPEEDVEWLTYAQTNDAPSDEDGYMNSQKVTFSYQWARKTVVQPILLKGANAALKRLFASCPR